MNKYIAPLMTAAFAFGVSASALANDDWNQDPAMQGAVGMSDDVSFDELDANNDGYVYQADVPADHELSTLFAQYDVDGDGRLSRSEFKAYSGDDVDSEDAE